MTTNNDLVPVAPVLGAEHAYINVTWNGASGDLPDPVRFNATEAEVIAWTEEALRSGSVRGIPADPSARLTDFRVKPLVAAPELGRFTNVLIVRPGTPFGR